MKNLILTISIVLTSLMSFAQTGITITVTVDNVPSNIQTMECLKNLTEHQTM